MSSQLTIENLNSIVNDIKYKNWTFRTGEMGNGFFLQLKFDMPDLITSNVEEQSGRKWYISKFMTKSEIVQTAFKACLTAEEHECREQFKYKQEQIFCPHFSVDELAEFASNSSRDKRK